MGLNKRQTVDIIGIEEYAKKHGIDPDYELPVLSKEDLSDKHKDKFIQTILKPKDLERKVHSIKRLSRTASTEKGINTLYLAMGFLEWVESENSDDKILSPLLLLPVELEEKRTKKGSEFIITGGNSDTQVNIVLKAKLEKDFGIVLKDFEEEETPEKYRILYSLNPMVGVIDGFRWAILGGESNIYIPGLILSLFVAVIFIIVGIMKFRKMEKTFADII